MTSRFMWIACTRPINSAHLNQMLLRLLLLLWRWFFFEKRKTSELFVNLDVFFLLLFWFLIFSLRFSRLNADLMTSQTSPHWRLWHLFFATFLLDKTVRARLRLLQKNLRKTTFFSVFLPVLTAVSLLFSLKYSILFLSALKNSSTFRIEKHRLDHGLACFLS